MRIVAVPSPCVARETRNALCSKCGSRMLMVRRYYADDDYWIELGSLSECVLCSEKWSLDGDGKPATLVLTAPPKNIFLDGSEDTPLG